ncbi:hypothetical protein ABHN05_08890 [Brevibacillus laterosporus]|uniref:hypothetical protein n=1 Tax=Brevibacillus laterosporus TaxID=1465 RepID=UPI00112BE4E7|nr:hypothetical protein [Brevibacillus laterosporus]MBG9804494.1 hypothetical protein [Brevibacillus laterosporus]MED4763979.1 hypothetical protein [Brevibacillus laterosporus]TPH17013.1 hypothetical protein EGH09_10475 [Brevibacillus laterosporus]
MKKCKNPLIFVTLLAAFFTSSSIAPTEAMANTSSQENSSTCRIEDNYWITYPLFTKETSPVKYSKDGYTGLLYPYKRVTYGTLRKVAYKGEVCK